MSGNRETVRKAWQMTQVHLKKLIWYGAIPSFFSIVVSCVYMLYQYNAFKSAGYLGGSGEHTMGLMKYFKPLGVYMIHHPIIGILIVIALILFGLGYFLIPPVLKGTLIDACWKIKNFKPIQGSFEVGIRKFFPLFEFGILTGSFGIITLFTESSFILRWWGENVFFFILPLFMFIAIVGFILSLLFTYAEYYIVIDGQGLIHSVKESVILVILNLKKTLLILILMLLISARIVLNVLLVLLIPMLIVFLGSYFAAKSLGALAIFAAIFVGLILILLASYLLGLFHVFSTTVWVLTFDEIAHKEGQPGHAHVEAAHGGHGDAHGGDHGGGHGGHGGHH